MEYQSKGSSDVQLQEHRPGAVYSWGLVAGDGRLGYVDDEVFSTVKKTNKLKWRLQDLDFTEIFGEKKMTFP